MPDNSHLHRARKRKSDEFLTRMEDIERELSNYPDAFRGKSVYCNCDDPFESNFFRYFAERFDELGLSRLTATCMGSETPDDNHNFETMPIVPSMMNILPWGRRLKTFDRVPVGQQYDDVIGTRTTDGKFHLIHVTSSRILAYQAPYGTPCYIYGQAK